MCHTVYVTERNFDYNTRELKGFKHGLLRITICAKCDRPANCTSACWVSTLSMICNAMLK